MEPEHLRGGETAGSLGVYLGGNGRGQLMELGKAGEIVVIESGLERLQEGLAQRVGRAFGRQEQSLLPERRDDKPLSGQLAALFHNGGIVGVDGIFLRLSLRGEGCKSPKGLLACAGQKDLILHLAQLVVCPVEQLLVMPFA